MGVLPDIAGNRHTSIPTAGHLISLYALGVVVGAPLFAVLGVRLPRKTLLLLMNGLLGSPRSTSASFFASFRIGARTPSSSEQTALASGTTGNGLGASDALGTSDAHGTGGALGTATRLAPAARSARSSSNPGERALGFFHLATGLWLMYLTFTTTLNISLHYTLPGG
jgi:hypothetical protein